MSGLSIIWNPALKTWFIIILAAITEFKISFRDFFAWYFKQRKHFKFGEANIYMLNRFGVCIKKCVSKFYYFFLTILHGLLLLHTVCMNVCGCQCHLIVWVCTWHVPDASYCQLAYQWPWKMLLLFNATMVGWHYLSLLWRIPPSLQGACASAVSERLSLCFTLTYSQSRTKRTAGADNKGMLIQLCRDKIRLQRNS